KPQATPTQNEAQAAHTNVNERRGLVWVCGILLVLVATAAAYFVWVLTQNTVVASNGLRILDRSEWMGEPPSGYQHLVTPVYNVIIHHTATEGCESEDVCIFRTRTIQNFHMNSLGFTDIGYNFLVGGDGQVYVGRGWHAQGQHVRGYGAVSISIAFIGTFVNVKPAEQQVQAAKRLMEEGVRLHKLHTDYHIYAHRQLSATESPGEKLFTLMQHWPRWSENVTKLRELNNEPLRFVTRDAWLAQPSVQPIKALALPVKNVRYVSTATESCRTQAMCTLRVRFLQALHIESHSKKDINYNFLVGGDGNVYVGRDWDYACEKFTSEETSFEGLLVGFVGNSSVTPSQMSVAKELLTRGIKLGKLHEHYQLIDELK
ncbi:PGRP-LF, partial [Drosophila busckii]